MKAFKQNQIELFKQFANSEISDTYFTCLLKLNEPKNIIVMYRFDDVNILYSVNDIVKDIHHGTKRNKELLIELICLGIENNSIEILG